MTDTPARPRKTTLSRPAPLWEASTWGPYFDALFPPQEVSPWIAWKIRSTGVGIARRLWDQPARTTARRVWGRSRHRPGAVASPAFGSRA